MSKMGERVALCLLCALLLVAGGCGRSQTQVNRPESTPSVESPESTRARGREACAGLTPIEAALHFRQSARKAGAGWRFLELATEPASSVQASPGYPRLVAALYAMSVPATERAQAAAGCAEELAATSPGGGAAPDRARMEKPSK
jgi:hypothetical protein